MSSPQHVKGACFRHLCVGCYGPASMNYDGAKIEFIKRIFNFHQALRKAQSQATIHAQPEGAIFKIQKQMEDILRVYLLVRKLA
jgi:hypothetical protein